MLNTDYLIKALQNDCHLSRDWVISCFSVTDYPIFEEHELDYFYDYQLVKSKADDNLLFFFDPENKEVPIPLDQYKPNTPLMNYKDKITLKPGDLINVKQEVNTTFGNCIFNAIALIYPFKDKVDFITGRVNPSKLESQLVDRLKDTPKEGEKRSNEFIYVDELEKHANAVTALEALNYTCVPTINEATMVANPAVIKRRDELLKQHAHELDKPAVIAKIQNELSQLDREYFKDNPANGFYLSGKSYDVIRMRKFGMMGLVGGFGGNTPQLVTKSLSEGWDPENFSAYADDIRNGSYSRGKSTAIAGFGVKLMYNAFQAITVASQDCKVTKGLKQLVTEENYGSFVGRYMIQGETTVELTPEILTKLIGKTITIRTPMLCRHPTPSFCAKCVGKSIAMLPNSVHITASDINSIYMNITMKSMHGKSLSTKRFNIFSNH